MKKFLSIVLPILILMGCFVACGKIENNVEAIKLVKSPEMVVYSAKNIFGSTRASDPNSNMWGWTPADITDDERANVVEWFETHQYPVSENIDWTDFFVQQVHKGSYSYTANNGGTVVGSDHMDYLVAGDNDHVYNFNNGNGSIMKMINSTTEKFGYHCSEDSQMHYTYVIIKINGEYYVGFDFEGNGQNPNQQIKRDGYYSDWIVKIVNADPSFNPDNENTDTPNKEPDYSINDTDEVEINLAIDDEHINGDYVSSHLSIHVRAVTDIEVIIPIPMEYYIQKDDVAIVKKHTENDAIYREEFSTRYEINGEFVTLTVEYNTDFIRIVTDGITENIINYLRDEYNDGITFEIWNYYNIDRSSLKEYLDKSTVRFLDNIPGLYVNAFVNDKDCFVDIFEEQNNLYKDPVRGRHYNNSDDNLLYRKK